MVTEHVSLNAPNGRYNSTSLVDDFKAVPTVMDHLLKTSDLPFDSPQAGDLSGVIYGIVTCDGLRWATRHSLPPENNDLSQRYKTLRTCFRITPSTGNVEGAFMSVDPVCGMEVDETTAAGKSAYRDQVFYFCSQQCKQKFDNNPETYTGD